jgi:guanylate kinase
MMAPEVGSMAAKQRGVLAIVSSPSGAGKSTLTQRLVDEFAPRLEFSVSYTTRSIRLGEVNGKHYWFVTPDVFEQMVQRGEFAEHAYVFDNRYGTAQAPVEAALAAGRDVIFDVDWQGGAALSARWPNDALKIFILPPSLEELERRLRSRATDEPDVIERRLRKAKEELEHYTEYPHLIVNDDLERSYAVLRAIYLRRRGDTATELARIVAANAASAPEAHARALVTS